MAILGRVWTLMMLAVVVLLALAGYRVWQWISDSPIGRFLFPPEKPAAAMAPAGRTPSLVERIRAPFTSPAAPPAAPATPAPAAPKAPAPAQAAPAAEPAARDDGFMCRTLRRIAPRSSLAQRACAAPAAPAQMPQGAVPKALGGVFTLRFQTVGEELLTPGGLHTGDCVVVRVTKALELIEGGPGGNVAEVFLPDYPGEDPITRSKSERTMRVNVIKEKIAEGEGKDKKKKIVPMETNTPVLLRFRPQEVPAMLTITRIERRYCPPPQERKV